MYVLFWLPGRMLVQMLRPLRGEPGWQCCALSASLMLMPVVLHWLWWFSNRREAVLAAIIVINTTLILLARPLGSPISATSPLFTSRKQRILFASLLAWVGLCVFLFNWMPVAGGRVIPSPSGDYIKHHALLWSLERYPLPLHNIFFAAESEAPYYYYEQFHLLPAALCVLSDARISKEFAFGLAAALTAVSFTGMVLLVARNVLGSTRGALLAASCATIVGGWDALPCFIRFVCTGRPIIVLDAWCPVLWRTHNIMNSFNWCPQHVAALGSLMLCCHWLQLGPNRQWWIVIAPIAAASILGSSAYMAMFAFAGAGVYVLLRGRETLRLHPARARRLFLTVGVIGALSAGLMGLRIWHYYLMNARFGGGATLSWDRFPHAFLGRSVAPGVLANWMEAPWLVPVEFGLGFVACLLATRVVWRRMWHNDGTRLLMIVAALGLAALWTIRTGITHLDYAYRMGSMATLVLGAICTGALLEPDQVRPFARRGRNSILIISVLIGLPVGLYEPPLIVARTFLETPPEQAYAGAARYVRRSTAPDAVVQPHPRDGSKLIQLMDRRTGVMDPMDPHVSVFCPPDRGTMFRALQDVESALRDPNAARAHALCTRWCITHLVVGPWELQRYGALTQFADPHWFESVYDDGQAKIYRLREPSRSE